MCGICGFTGGPDRSLLDEMTGCLVHRGPDEGGCWEAPEISFGIRRLAIIDVASGQQPVANEDRSIVAVFNGEIYNHPELRAELEQKGHRFRSDHSDTEVIVHLYQEYGVDYLQYLDGMFAIALWDTRRQELHLARDRTGIKPLYFAWAHGRLLFASEPKALLRYPGVKRTPDFHALHHYFTFKNVPAPLSAFAGIEQLRPGERAVVRDGQLSRTRWWRIQFAEQARLDEQTAAERIAGLLEDSVRMHMRSDVPFGAYLSGGLDSSSVVALMSKLGERRVKTFSLTYADQLEHKAADRHFARLVSETFGTEHYECELSLPAVVDSMDAVLGAFDEPFAGVTSTFFLTGLIAQHVKVALSGDGADELFGSYLAHRLAQPLACRAATGAGESDQLSALLARGDEAARRMAQYLWDESGKAELYTDAMRELTMGADSEQVVRDLYAQSGTDDPLNRALFVDFETLLPDQVLAFVDRLSMAHSVEVRPPYLDWRLVEFTASLPGSMKIKQTRVKHILKEALRGLVPDDVVDRPKEGFVLPINHWLTGGLREYALDTLSPARLSRHGLLRSDTVQRILTEHYDGRAQHGPRIWALLTFQRWWEQYVA